MQIQARDQWRKIPTIPTKTTQRDGIDGHEQFQVRFALFQLKLHVNHDQFDLQSLPEAILTSIVSRHQSNTTKKAI